MNTDHPCSLFPPSCRLECGHGADEDNTIAGAVSWKEPGPLGKFMEQNCLTTLGQPLTSALFYERGQCQCISDLRLVFWSLFIMAAYPDH